MANRFLTAPVLLLSMVFIMSFGFSIWQVLLNNFVIEQAGFSGVEIGILQSVREIPGFLAFAVIYLLLFIREQRLALLSLLIMALGVLLTGLFPFEYGLYATTLLMSIGFHIYETINKSLTLQWIAKDQTAPFMGRALSVKAMGALVAYGLVWLLMSYFNVSYAWMYAFAGGSICITVLILWRIFPQFPRDIPHRKQLFLKRRYWLYYLLVFLSGARRQIFVVFAGFMMVE